MHLLPNFAARRYNSSAVLALAIVLPRCSDCTPCPRVTRSDGHASAPIYKSQQSDQISPHWFSFGKDAIYSSSLQCSTGCPRWKGAVEQQVDGEFPNNIKAYGHIEGLNHLKSPLIRIGALIGLQMREGREFRSEDGTKMFQDSERQQSSEVRFLALDAAT